MVLHIDVPLGPRALLVAVLTGGTIGRHCLNRYYLISALRIVGFYVI
jgi:hypothetical protein